MKGCSFFFVSITKVGRTYATLFETNGAHGKPCLDDAHSVAFANVLTIAVEELRPGMTGYGKTVFQGTKIETFDVEVLGVTGSETGAIASSSVLLEITSEKMAVFPKA